MPGRKAYNNQCFMKQEYRMKKVKKTVAIKKEKEGKVEYISPKIDKHPPLNILAGTGGSSTIYYYTYYYY